VTPIVANFAFLSPVHRTVYHVVGRDFAVISPRDEPHRPFFRQGKQEWLRCSTFAAVFFTLSTMGCLTGIHAVHEALEAQRPLERIVIASGRQDSRIQKIVELARAQNVPVRFEDRSQLDRLANSRDHQGVVALSAVRQNTSFEDLLGDTNKDRGRPGLVVLLDGVEDPHNLGAIIRTSLAAGAHGVVIPERRAVGLTDVVARASAGALAHLPVARVTNLVRCMEELKEAGYWLVGLDEHAEKKYTEVDYTSPVGIVMGGEGKGLHELTRKRCDFVVSLPTSGPVKSLNVSVATGVVLFEVLRQRQRSAKP
jgi:23S rRNA (guanosine2251-2'-O)-methyltransferase